MRLFVALALPDSVSGLLREISCGLPGARWTMQHHLTLHFIGDADGAQFQDIRDALAAVQAPPFPMQLRGIGFFPPRGVPHTLWVGVEHCEALLLLRQRVVSALKATGIEPEARKFAPHITLARLKDTPVSKAADYIAQHSLFSAPPFAVNAFRLYSSILRPEGSAYSVAAEYLLGE